MKIKEVIDIIGDFNVPIIPIPAGRRQKGKLPIYATEKGVHFYKDDTIWGISTDNSDMSYDIKMYLKRLDEKLEGNERELNKYLTVYELLSAIKSYKGENGNISFEQLKVYVALLNRKIIESLDFSEVSGMNDLIDLVSKDSLYREQIFNVSVVNCYKAQPFRGSTKPLKNYHFGNIEYHEELDKVNITLYNDCVELHHEAERISHKRNLDLEVEYTEEQKIFTALGCWRGYYLN